MASVARPWLNQLQEKLRLEVFQDAVLTQHPVLAAAMGPLLFP